MIIKQENVNFIAVDWSVGSWQLPMFAMLEVESVALIVSDFVRNLTSLYGIPAKDMHVIGHSLGGRVAGKVGASLKPKLGRITGNVGLFNIKKKTQDNWVQLAWYYSHY